MRSEYPHTVKIPVNRTGPTAHELFTWCNQHVQVAEKHVLWYRTSLWSGTLPDIQGDCYFHFAREQDACAFTLAWS